MDIVFPFIPKSNSKLKPGHFWPIQLSNGKYACGIVLDVPLDKNGYNTRNIYAGLLSWTNSSKPTVQDLESSSLKIIDQGHAHIKTITIQSESIVGLIDLRKNNLEINMVVDSQTYSINSIVLKGFEIIRKATIRDHTDLKTKSSWGYSVIIISANRLLGQ